MKVHCENTIEEVRQEGDAGLCTTKHNAHKYDYRYKKFLITNLINCHRWFNQRI